MKKKDLLKLLENTPPPIDAMNKAMSDFTLTCGLLFNREVRELKKELALNDKKVNK